MDEPIRPKAGTIEALNPDGTVDVRVGPRVLGRTMGDARPTFCGVPFAEFCTRDRQYVEDAVAAGAVGIAGLCAACSAKCDAASEAAAAANGEAEPEPRTYETPLPWEWKGGELVAANGNPVLTGRHGGEVVWAKRADAALIAVAPEMLALLRELETGDCPVCRADPHEPDCRLAALLARLPKDAP